MTHTVYIVALLAALNVCTAMAVVYTKHLSRDRYTSISQSQRMIDDLDVQWSQLQIEESTFSDHARVEKTASDRLGMVQPGLDGSVMIVRKP